VAPAGTGANGTVQNALAAALTLDSTKAATFAGAVSSSSVTVGNTLLQSGYLQARTLFATSSGGVNQVALFPSVGGQAGVWVGAAYPIVFANVNDVNGATGDVFLFRDAANTFAQRNGTANQTFRLYGTYTDASNYERLNISANSSGHYIIGEEGGTGSP
jgi:hypothetical protein